MWSLFILFLRYIQVFACSRLWLTGFGIPTHIQSSHSDMSQLEYCIYICLKVFSSVYQNLHGYPSSDFPNNFMSSCF